MNLGWLGLGAGGRLVWVLWQAVQGRVPETS